MKFKNRFFAAAIVCAIASVLMLANNSTRVQTLSIVPIMVGFVMAILASVETVEPTE